MVYLFLLLLGIALVSSDPNGCCENDKTCDETPWAIEKNGLYWAWASPCSGGCSNLHPNLPWGWRRATDAEFNAAKPFNSASFGCPLPQCPQPVTDPNVCAAEHFDDRWTHCDTINLNDGKYTNDIENVYWETILVHDIDSNCPGSKHAINYGPCDKNNLINCMDQRIRALEGHFYPIPNAISELEKYFNDNGESILDLDLSIRKLVNGGNGNTASDAINDYLKKPSANRNSYNLLEMDIELYNLQQRAKDLENKEDALEDNDYDKEIFVLIKQAQCELSQLGLPEEAIDCRVNSCFNNNDLKKMFDDLSPPPDGQCPIGYQERAINNLQNGAHSLNYNNKPDISNNINKLFNNKGNNGNNLDMLQKQIYILYALIALLFTTSITIFCYSFYGSGALPKKSKKMVYEPVEQ